MRERQTQLVEQQLEAAQKRAAEEEADPNDPSPDNAYYDLGDDGDDEIMDNEIGNAQDVDGDESLGKISATPM